MMAAESMLSKRLTSKIAAALIILASLLLCCNPGLILIVSKKNLQHYRHCKRKAFVPIFMSVKLNTMWRTAGLRCDVSFIAVLSRRSTAEMGPATRLRLARDIKGESKLRLAQDIK